MLRAEPHHCTQAPKSLNVGPYPPSAPGCVQPLTTTIPISKRRTSCSSGPPLKGRPAWGSSASSKRQASRDQVPGTWWTERQGQPSLKRELLLAPLGRRHPPTLPLGRTPPPEKWGVRSEPSEPHADELGIEGQQPQNPQTENEVQNHSLSLQSLKRPRGESEAEDQLCSSRASSELLLIQSPVIR